MSEYPGIKATQDLLQYVTAHLLTLPKERSVSALNILRTGAAMPLRPFVGDGKVPFNQVPLALIHPKTQEVYFVGIKDGACAKPAQLCRLRFTGCPEVLAEAERIDFLMMIGDEIGFVVYSDSKKKFCVGDGRRPWTEFSLSFDFGHSKGVFLSLNNAKSFVHTHPETVEDFHWFGEDTHYLPYKRMRGWGLRVLHDRLFWYTNGYEDGKYETVIHWGDFSQEYKDSVLEDAFANPDGSISYALAMKPKQSGTLFLYTLTKDGQLREEVLKEGGSDSNEVLSTEHHGFLMSENRPHYTSELSDLLTGHKIRNIPGRVTHVREFDEGVAILSRDLVPIKNRDDHFVTVWKYSALGGLLDADACQCTKKIPKYANAGLIAHGAYFGFVELRDGKEAILVWCDRILERREEVPLYGPLHRLTKTDDGRVMSWYFAGNTLFLTDYSPVVY